MEKYDAKSLILVNWPRAECMADGHWLRVWQVHFKEAIAPHISLENLSVALSEDDFCVSLMQDAPDELIVRVATYKRHGESDEVVFANYALLEKLNERIATIATIQGQERDLWLPWRTS